MFESISMTGACRSLLKHCHEAPLKANVNLLGLEIILTPCQ